MSVHLSILIRALQIEARACFQRRLVVLSGTHGWCREQSAEMLVLLDRESSVWVGEGAPAGTPQIDNKAALSRLGSECDALVYDAFAGFDTDAFGALCGTLCGGGLLLLLTPPLSAWGSYADPEHTRLCVAGIQPDAVKGRFLTRLARVISDDPSVVCIQEGEPLPIPLPLEPCENIPTIQDADCRTPDQAKAVAALIHVATGHPKRPFVLISDRGRGKSVALGIAAARLLGMGRQKILVTGPRLSATDSLFAQAARLLPNARVRAGMIEQDHAFIRYSAPDHLLSEPHPCDLLLVDEAAAIPTPLLQGLLERYPRIAFATTVHGYEGTGRGFSVRFQQYLSRHRPRWHELRLSMPVRWAPGDPLERCLFRALALDANPVADDLVADLQVQELSFAQLDRDQLTDNDAELNELFGLLVLAHYRTTPYDLRNLLDGPNLRIYVLRARGHIVATALLALEGGFDTQTAEGIWAGLRRPQGHLLAQTLAAHVGLADGAQMRAGRIMRIAVHPALQRRGLGSLLLEQLIHETKMSDLDYLGSCFGATPELLRFWGRNRFVSVHLGLHHGASSGEPSVCLLHPLSPAGNKLLNSARQAYLRRLPHLLAEPLNMLDPVLGALLLTDPERGSLQLPEEDWRELHGFAFAKRGFENTLPLLEALALHALAVGTLKLNESAVLVAKVLQHRPWKDCADHFGLTGRTELETWLRSIVGNLINRFAHQT